MFLRLLPQPSVLGRSGRPTPTLSVHPTSPPCVPRPPIAAGGVNHPLCRRQAEEPLQRHSLSASSTPTFRPRRNAWSGASPISAQQEIIPPSYKPAIGCASRQRPCAGSLPRSRPQRLRRPARCSVRCAWPKPTTPWGEGTCGSTSRATRRSLAKVACTKVALRVLLFADGQDSRGPNFAAARGARLPVFSIVNSGTGLRKALPFVQCADHKCGVGLVVRRIGH